MKDRDLRIYELINQGREILEEHHIENSAYDAKALMMYILDCDRARLYLLMNDAVKPEQERKYREAIQKRSTHYPLQYITGTQGFMGYEFRVNENVLIPRQDTEILVEQALLSAEKMGAGQNIPLRVLDMCTGSGCIGISYYLQRKEKGFKDCVTLADISEGALLMAAENAEKLGADVYCVKSDLFDGLEPPVLDNINCKSEGRAGFDLILSNPPYIESDVIPTLMQEVKDYEPLHALDGYADGLHFYRQIIEKARTFLNKNGGLILEIGYNQYDAVRGLLAAQGFTDITLTKDYAGLDRVVSARYCK